MCIHLAFDNLSIKSNPKNLGRNYKIFEYSDRALERCFHLDNRFYLSGFSEDIKEVEFIRHHQDGVLKLSQ